MKKALFTTFVFFGLVGCLAISVSCNSTQSKQQSKVLAPGNNLDSTELGQQQVEVQKSDSSFTHNGWETWSSTIIVYRVYDNGDAEPRDSYNEEDSRRCIVERRVIDREKEYRIKFSNRWHPVSTTTKKGHYIEDIIFHYRFVSNGYAYYFDM